MLTACLFFHPFVPLLLFGLYFLPTILGAQRSHDNVTGLFLVNFFFGWTGIGWIAALIWALTATPMVYFHPAYAMPMGSARCPRCGCGLVPGAAFCTNCGTRG
jgi:hypothetical protein